MGLRRRPRRRVRSPRWGSWLEQDHPVWALAGRVAQIATFWILMVWATDDLGTKETLMGLLVSGRLLK